MMTESSNLERFGALSDGIFAVIITIMVLELKPPADHDLKALLELWPNAISYAISYLFIAVVWLNHHHVFQYARRLTGVLAWSNFVNLFAISLIPFTTAWMASTKVAAFPVTLYAVVFLLVELTYIVLMFEAFRQGVENSGAMRAHRIHFKRAWIMVAVFSVAAFAYPVPPAYRLGLMAIFLIFHIRPNLLRRPTS